MATSSSSKKDIVLLVLVGLIAAAAMLSQYVQQYVPIRKDFLIVALVTVVCVGLFMYLRFAVVAIIVLLLFGANLPGWMAEEFNVSKWPFVVALVVLVLVSLFNHWKKKLPTGLEKNSSEEARRALFYAIERDNPALLKQLLSMKLDPNIKAPDGTTALMLATARGDTVAVDTLVRAGADVSLLNAQGDSAVDIALRLGNQTMADLLKTIRVMQVEKKANSRD